MPGQVCTITLEQSIVPSSGSVTVTVYGTRSPNSKNPPFGTLRVTTGRVLPTVTSVVATAVVPAVPVTVSLAVNLPRLVYVYVGLAAVESVLPLPSKSQA